nr:hypothetical protein [Tanacetum cinerariifolium]
MRSMEKTIVELHAMLKLHEKGIPKKAETPTVLAIRRGLRGSRKLKHRALNLYVGNGMRKAVKAIGSFDLVLPSGLIIILDNCLHTIFPDIQDLHFSSDSLIVLMYEKKMKFMEQPTRPAPDTEIADPDTIDKYYETVNLEQEVAYLMLSKKYNAYDMMKELKNMFEEQAKHELFQTVKAFHACKQEEGQLVSSYLLKMKRYLDTLECLGYAIPNELGKTLAELHDMLKLYEKGIPKKAETPDVLAIREGKIQKDKKKKPVSERRNRTLLDMVRSMMNLTTLPKSFWGYALKFVARILNMVPTKKVERTPYEIWHGKALKLTYLRVWVCYYFYYPHENKIFVAQNAKLFENKLIVLKASGSHGLLKASGSDVGLELIQEDDTQPSKNTSEIHDEVVPTNPKC